MRRITSSCRQTGLLGRTILDDTRNGNAANLVEIVAGHVFFADVFSIDAQETTTCQEAQTCFLQHHYRQVPGVGALEFAEPGPCL